MLMGSTNRAVSFVGPANARASAAATPPLPGCAVVHPANPPIKTAMVAIRRWKAFISGCAETVGSIESSWIDPRGDVFVEVLIRNPVGRFLGCLDELRENA